MKNFNLLLALLTIYLSAFSQAPTITSFLPASGPVGTLVTIYGTNLSNPTSFTIGGVAAILVSGSSDTIVGMVMPGAVTGGVSVTTAIGTVAAGGNYTVTPTLYPNTQQGPKLVGTGAINSPYYAQQGYSVSISADGNTAIVGGPYDNKDTGAVWIYTLSGSNWTQQGNKLVGTGAVGAAVQGWSVALSADGNTAAIGGYEDNNNTGAVWVFTRIGSLWAQQGPKLVGSGAAGHSVALSADGNTVVIGAPWDSSNIGAISIYTRSGSLWSQQGPKLVGTGAVANTYFGWSVGISADGNTAIVGGPGSYVGGNSSQFNDTGAIWIFIRSGSIWSQQGPRLQGMTGTKNAGEGTSVALSADGNTAIVGSPGDSTSASDGGAVWVFTRAGSVWSQQGNKLIGTGAINGFQGAQQGQSVALSADGNTAIIGGPGDTYNTGAIWAYKRTGSTWTQEGNKLVGAGTAGGVVIQGWSAALSADGKTMIEGGMLDNSFTGAAWVFGTACAPDSTTSYDTICASALPYMWNGQTFTQAGTQTALLTNTGGCDSIATLILTVTNILNTSLSANICAGGSYTFNGHNLTTTGTYRDTLTSSVGCDSMVSLTLMVNNILSTSISHSICGGSSYSFGNVILSSAGTYTDTLTSSEGCDSIVTLNLSVIPAVYAYIFDTLYNGQSITLGNHTYSQFGTYRDTIASIAGCDSIVTLQLYVITGISEINASSLIHLYPNPNKGSFTLQTSGSIGSNYTISDMLGHIIMQRAIKADSEAIEMPDVADGVYTLSLAGVQPIRFAVLR